MLPFLASFNLREDMEELEFDLLVGAVHVEHPDILQGRIEAE